VNRVHGDLVERAAGFWRRWLGSFVDGLVLAIVGLVLRLADLPGTQTAHGGFVLDLVGGSDLGVLVAAAYFTFFHGRTGRTPGNAVVGIRVIDARTGVEGAIGYPRAAVRWLVSIPSALVLLLGYLSMLWDGSRQTWHDRAAGSLPIYERGLPPRPEVALDEGWADRHVG
jgi:uncharacterized RDD family membrane protein YckC